MTGRAAVTGGPVRILVIGDWDDAIAALQAELSALPEVIEVTFSAAQQHVSLTGPPPDLIVVLQQHPDDHSPQQVRDLLNSCPLSRLIIGYGPWCESDGRTRQLWPPACRVPEGRLLPRVRRELAVVRGESPALPLTADRDECWEHDFATVATAAARPLSVAVSTPDPAVAEWLAEALTTAGHRIVASESAADVLLFDADPWNAQRSDVLKNILRQHVTLPVVALAGYLRKAEQQSLRESGVRSVASKLAPLSELCRMLGASIAIPPPHQPTLQIVRD
jgi:hypothetical protein